ncbi:B12-binding domain-containing radical SAM protein [Desulfurococcus mucosus]|uniref:Radical SAM domain protein n=1 Tax=Desulfurococcus mucosus (strain ATCC 35584 / DSM 2162 / JCM 9187 / O7/1) TaxID=765177 RepID=E8R7S4_DESM0|nr:radical SAM protein [Desulfurococcus mucosus]ADV64550.1 Radical SAM domain protein [Desulfurococcus mucosus DSM 2162]
MLVVDALARSTGRRYSTHDVVGAGPRLVAGILSERTEAMLLPYERVVGDKGVLAEASYLFISIMSSDLGALDRLVTYARRVNPSLKVVAGGPASFQYASLLMEHGVDYVIVGEAEIPLPRFLDCIVEEKCDPSTVPALGFRVNDSVRLTSSHIHTPRDVLSSIKPWTRVDETLVHPQVYRIYVEVVRGCSNYSRPMVKGHGGLNCVFCGNCRSDVGVKRLTCPAGIPPGCGFCSVPSMFGPARSRSIESIVREVEELVEHGARRIVLSAPDFLDYGRDLLVEGVLTHPCEPPANINAIEGLLSGISSLGPVSQGKVVVMIENIKACLVNEDVARVLGRYLRGTPIHIGLETGNDVFNERVLGKPVRVRHVLEAVRLLKGHGLRPYVYLMHSLPLASKTVYEDTIRVVNELGRIGVEKITLYKYTPLPNTAFEKLPPESKGVEKYIAELKTAVTRHNTRQKMMLLGSTLEAYVVENSGKLYGYPARHGPVIFLGSAPRKGLNGCLTLVEVTGVGDRYVKGRILRVKECP